MNRLDARTMANRENAKKSTGPRTEEGKKRSRANAFRHGLAGAGVAWPGEDEGALRAFVVEQVEADPVGPRDAHEAFLMERVATIAWQVDRAERAEEAQAAIRADRAVGAERERRAGEVAGFVAMLEDEPARAVRGFLRSKEGCDWIVDALKELIDAVDADWWLDSHNIRLDALCAPVQPGRLRISRAKALGLALGCAEYGAIWPNGIPGYEDALPPDATPAESLARLRAERQVAREHRPKWNAELRTILERRLAEVERWRDAFQSRPDPGLELAALASTFDASEPSERLRRHLRARERERARVQAELDAYRTRIEAAGAEQAVREPEPGPESQASEDGPVATPAPELPALSAPESARNDRGLGLGLQWVTSKRVRSVGEEDALEATNEVRTGKPAGRS